MASSSYFEVRSADGVRERLDGVNTVEAAKAACRTVAKLTGSPVELYRVTEVDIDAPPQTRRTS